MVQLFNSLIGAKPALFKARHNNALQEINIFDWLVPSSKRAMVSCSCANSCQATKVPVRES